MDESLNISSIGDWRRNSKSNSWLFQLRNFMYLFRRCISIIFILDLVCSLDPTWWVNRRRKRDRVYPTFGKHACRLKGVIKLFSSPSSSLSSSLSLEGPSLIIGRWLSESKDRLKLNSRGQSAGRRILSSSRALFFSFCFSKIYGTELRTIKSNFSRLTFFPASFRNR